MRDSITVGRHRHGEQVLDRAVFALAYQSGARQYDRQHGDVVDDLHHRCEPVRVQVRIEHDTGDEIYRQWRSQLHRH